ncbi:Protein of unknown function DUF1685 [Cynara cardunculus var. scolymus]|uniref:Uncharacterized protein n=1 Tax=Cynara cardunculus var. scolymus TaxID=59895 RepID=A0A103XHL6_CYNCS|nr:Protein of unknown function DUF1685 [Cynara cardunculus var. scolymus]
MGSCSCASISSIPERIFHEEQYSELEFSDETAIDHQNRSAFFKYEDSWSKNNSSIRRKKNQVFLEGYVETSDEDDLVRAKSLTDEDLDELKGCFDLGFGFSYDEIPELCNTLPALELCYSMSQKFLDEQQKSPEVSSPRAAEPLNETASPPPPPPPPPAPIANWKISSPGECF